MKKFYIETSAANFFLNSMNEEGAASTKSLQLSKGRCWFISTTVLWEFLQIVKRSDLHERLSLGSYLFHDQLLKSAAEMGIEYIEKGMPDYLVLDTPFTASALGDKWHRACMNKRYSFFLDDPLFINVTAELKRISRHIRYIVGDRENVTPVVDESINGLALFLDEIYKKQFSESVKPPTMDLRKISLLVIFIQLCLGIDITRDIVERYWQKKKVRDPFERMSYLIEHSPGIITRGPFWNIANAIFIQCVRSGLSSRGAFHDGLHAVYLPFIDFFLTKDKHFQLMRDKAIKEYRDLLYDKIFHMDEVEYFKVEYPKKPNQGHSVERKKQGAH